MRVGVWAPAALTMTCRVGNGDDSRDVRMDGPDKDGWWTGPELAPGTDYALVVDGEGPYPDPRSPRQPYGVHGSSRTYDASAFQWTDHDWAGRDARGSVAYELHVGAFSPAGTLDSAVEQLPRLAHLGVELVQLMPIIPFPGTRGWGYDGVSPFAVHEPYGGPEALQRFVDAAHAAGLAVALDAVYNHMGPDGNYLGKFGPYFTDAHDTPWGWGANLDQAGSEQVRRFFIDNALRWFRDFHIDSLRLDAVHALKDDSPRHFLAELADAVAELSSEVGRPLSLVAESDLNDVAMVTPTAEGGLGMTAQWADDVHHALHAFLTQERHGYYVDFGSLETLDHAFRHVFVHDGGYSTFRGTDWGAPVPDGVDRRRFVVFASNHDQVGNRAIGDRPSARLSPGAQATALALVLMGPFTPMLFMGEEYGETRPFQFFTDHAEPLGTAVTKGRIDEFATHGWAELYGEAPQVPDPQAPETLARSTISGAPVTAEQGALLAWTTALIEARAATLVTGAWAANPVSITEPLPGYVTMTGPIHVHANLGKQPVTFQGRLLAAFGDVAQADGQLHLAPQAVALVTPEER